MLRPEPAGRAGQIQDRMPDTPKRSMVIAAFAAVYIIWGSTYLAIFYAIETLPPLLMAAARFLVAGAILYAWAGRGVRMPTRAEWKAAAVIGALLLLGGNGAVVWAEQLIPSGVAALLVSITPCWMVLLEWLWNRGERPGVRTVLGLVLGFGGLVLLIGPSALAGTGAIHPLGALVVLAGSLCWATGSIYSRRAPRPPGALLFTGMQMLCGGTLLLIAGGVGGEFADFHPGAVSTRSLLALLYLIVFGAIIAYSAYVWLLRVVSPARVSTYAYVNPVVAVLLGWALAGEPLSPRMALAAAIIIAGVALITLGQQSRRARTPARATA